MKKYNKPSIDIFELELGDNILESTDDRIIAPEDGMEDEV